MDQLYFGDNLQMLLWSTSADESNDLISILDPPFDFEARLQPALQVTERRDERHADRSPLRIRGTVKSRGGASSMNSLHQPNTSVADMIPPLRGIPGEHDILATLTMMPNLPAGTAPHALRRTARFLSPLRSDHVALPQQNDGVFVLHRFLLHPKINRNYERQACLPKRPREMCKGERDAAEEALSSIFHASGAPNMRGR